MPAIGGITGISSPGPYYTYYYLNGGTTSNNWAKINNVFVRITNSAQSSNVTGRSYCVLNNLIYEYGGYDQILNSFTNVLYVFNPLANSWTALSSSPSPTGTMTGGLVACNNKIYAIGGFNGTSGGMQSSSTNNVYEYDPTIDTWTIKNNMPDSVTAGCCSYNNIIYRLCGRDGSAPNNLLYMYNPISDVWTALANHPNTDDLTGIQPVPYANKLWCVGGNDGNTGQPVAACFVYDIFANTWTSFAPAPQPTANQQVMILNNILYILSGGTSSGNTTTNIYSYRFETGLWTKETPNAPDTVLVGGTNQGVSNIFPEGLGGS